ncbi:predicted protein [Histoplasma capsulatum var. duboisii H88]|uniref:Predicted protein n=1 Tax=Ajellomyces capsulatus (strain H88) TaxID=544711 RepID=F0UH35_AJEC8|nr:predicted protein [Histoplasma capsulatum var. duboisii H88]
MTAGWGHFSDSRVAKSRAEKGAFLILAKVKRQLVAAGNQRVKQSCHVMSGGHNGSELIFPPRDQTVLRPKEGCACESGVRAGMILGWGHGPRTGTIILRRRDSGMTKAA